MKLHKKHLHSITLLPLPLLLAACAGGSGVDMPNTLRPQPILSATVPENETTHTTTWGDKYPSKLTPIESGTEAGKLSQFHTNDKNAGKLLAYDLNVDWGTGNYRSQGTKFFYQAADGKIYEFNTFSQPILPDSFFPDKNLRTRQEGQKTDNGGTLFACCEAGQTQYAATKATSLRFGSWVDAQGNGDLFVGGLLADVSKMQGASSNGGKPKGKATYEVWAFRLKNGTPVSSSYLPNSGKYDENYKTIQDGVRSLITANFNTNKMGGTIKGNSDFGADIVLTDVNINGTSFAGSAISDNVVGKVEGAFFNNLHSTYYDTNGNQIGGKITFENKRSLDSVFGGLRSRLDKRTDSQDLEPLY